MHCLHLKSIKRILVNLLIFAHIPRILIPQDLHNNAFAIDYLFGNATLIHRARLSYIDQPNSTYHNLSIHQSHLHAFSLKFNFPAICFSYGSAIVSAVKIKSSAYNIFCNMPSFALERKASSREEMEEHKVNYFQGLVQTGKAQDLKTCAHSYV